MEEKLVQALVVLHREENRHEATLQAVGQASLQAFPGEGSSWDSWLQASWTKTVRRARPKDFQRLQALPLAEGGPLFHLVGEVEVLAWEPQAYEAMHPLLRRTQVSGLAYHESPPLPGTAPLAVRESLPMSTGKAAAQVAHGLWKGYLLGLWGQEAKPHLTLLGEEEFQDLRGRAAAVIRDAGLTELPGPTDTILVGV